MNEAELPCFMTYHFEMFNQAIRKETILTGNALVVTAVVCFRRLRSVTNFFVISLAIADITVRSFPFLLFAFSRSSSFLNLHRRAPVS